MKQQQQQQRITPRRLVWVLGILAAAALAPAAQAQDRIVIIRPSGVTTVRIPDGGTASLAGYTRVSESRSEFGVPVLGKVPYIGRGFRGVSYGRSTVIIRTVGAARVIDLREEEYRQTGFRSP